MENVCLRCYKCNHEFEKVLDVKDNITDIICPACGKKTIECNMGVKPKKVITEYKRNG